MRAPDLVIEYIKALDYVLSCAQSVLYEEKKKDEEAGKDFSNRSSAWFQLDAALKRLRD